MRTIEAPEVRQPVNAKIEPVQEPTAATEPTKPAKSAVSNTKPQVQREKREFTMSDDELDMLNTIYRATVNTVNLAREERTLVAKLEDVRGELNGNRETRDSLIKQLPEWLLKTRDGIELSSEDLENPSDDIELSSGSSVSDNETPADQANPKTNWRNQPTIEFAEGVSGLGERKLNTLADSFPTVGELNDARIRAANSRQHFSSELPNGLGKRIADELTERLMSAETNGDTRPASEVVEPRVEASGEAVSAEIATDEVVLSDDWITGTVKQLRDDNGGDYSFQFDADVWQEGYDAFTQSNSIDECPDDLTDDYRTDWLVGWLAAEAVRENADSATPKAEKSSEPVDGSAEPDESVESVANEQYDDVEDTASVADDSPGADAMTTDELLAFSASLGDDSNPDTSCKSSKDHWTEGYEAGVDEQEASDCPLLEIDAEQQRDWIRGWFEGCMVGEGL